MLLSIKSILMLCYVLRIKSAGVSEFESFPTLRVKIMKSKEILVMHPYRNDNGRIEMGTSKEIGPNSYCQCGNSLPTEQVCELLKHLVTLNLVNGDFSHSGTVYSLTKQESELQKVRNIERKYGIQVISFEFFFEPYNTVFFKLNGNQGEFLVEKASDYDGKVGSDEKLKEMLREKYMLCQKKLKNL
jgi:hypothetical protein